MLRYTTIEKKVGETPLQALERVRVRDAIPPDVPLAYAGRLDPMASGLLLVLIGEECKRQKQYHSLDKQYDFELLLGLETDTGDIMGLPHQRAPTQSLTNETIAHVCASLVGSITLPYPPFSSKTVHGKPLFLWALEERLSEIEIPQTTTLIYSLTHTKTSVITSHDLLARIEERVMSLPSVTEPSKALGKDFRRGSIMTEWRSLLDQSDRTYVVLTFSAICSSGTYIRSLAPHIAEALGSAGLALSIHRTRIGIFRQIPLFGYGIWVKRY